MSRINSGLSCFVFATGESYFEGRKSLFKSTNGFTLPDLDGEGGMLVDTDKAVAAAWRCGTDDAADEGRGIILEIRISDADRGRRNLRQDAVGIITLIEPWACGEQPVPGATATSPVNRPWPTAYPDSDSD